MAGAVQYHIYSNSGIGDAVDYSTPVATVDGLSWESPVLAAGSDWTFAVRAFRVADGLEEQNVDVRVRVALDGAGADLAALPPAPVGLTLYPVSAGLQVAWAYAADQNRGTPTSFKVWVTAGATVNFAAAPTATVTYDASRQHYLLAVAGLTPGAQYAVGVRAANAAGTEANATQLTATIPDTAPGGVVGLAGGVA